MKSQTHVHAVAIEGRDPERASPRASEKRYPVVIPAPRFEGRALPATMLDGYVEKDRHLAQATAPLSVPVVVPHKAVRDVDSASWARGMRCARRARVGLSRDMTDAEGETS